MAYGAMYSDLMHSSLPFHDRNKKVIFTRMWHVDLLPYLPRQQLVAQWRECCCIANDWAAYGSPNHILVNVITKYPLAHFVWYCHAVLEAMWDRGYEPRDVAITRINANISYISEQSSLFELYGDVLNPIPKAVTLYPGWMNDRYLIQCYFNLEEKYDRGGISPDEWEVLNDYVSSRVEHLL